MARKGNSCKLHRFATSVVGLPFLTLSSRPAGMLAGSENPGEKETPLRRMRKSGKALDIMADIDKIGQASAQGSLTPEILAQADSLRHAIEMRHDLTESERRALRNALNSNL